ncbi:MAG: sigma-E factor negative regulatory protein [Methylococcales bacterium]|nr:sigma-E factor negative regulatory protein [Methylococcales bacterium]
MSNSIHEQISCLLDDELPPEQATQLLQQLRDDATLRHHYHRQQALRMRLHHEPTPPMSTDFLEQINAQLHPSRPSMQSLKAAGHPVNWSMGLLALAAALLIWLTVNNMPQTTSLAPTTLAHTSSTHAASHARLREYLQAHNSSRYVGRPILLTAHR